MIRNNFIIAISRHIYLGSRYNYINRFVKSILLFMPKAKLHAHGIVWVSYHRSSFLVNSHTPPQTVDVVVKVSFLVNFKIWRIWHCKYILHTPIFQSNSNDIRHVKSSARHTHMHTQNCLNLRAFYAARFFSGGRWNFRQFSQKFWCF